ncbi:MAG: glycine hydroxymethyltransferase [Candidatus Berkelbacteria bacterium Licking1014_2]|uniref:Serine hydroxymethyltransferase n=1 Tax=Candidatus Berkelbacteria bacterium Licking1014_2 TaxID=2017146 RepID=A0A554LW55_9BACT|nr:MAG: glycine hydroxymethyltransferase [Candidatus Berkelbacteria bacterium Licking1014_2]
MIDQYLQKLVKREERRQRETIDLIASENYPSDAVRQMEGSIFMSKYAEGYPGKRYYAGQENADALEVYTKKLAQKVFRTNYEVNVQALSGSPANLAVYTALLEPGDKVLSMALDQGGHLTHGSLVNISGKLYCFYHYGVDKKTGLIDEESIYRLAKKIKPKMIVAGATAYPRQIDFAKIAAAAQKLGIYYMVDISHIAGLVVVGQHPSPFGHADVITTTTHKTLRGPRGALIFSRTELASKIDKAVFPGLQGGPHLQTIAAIGQCLSEASQPEFKVYIKQVIKNCRALAEELTKLKYILISGGTDNHLLLIDMQKSLGIDGNAAQKVLEQVDIVCNKNTIPYDSGTPQKPSGIRLGTAAMTTRGAKEKDFVAIARLLNQALRNCNNGDILKSIARGVKELAAKFKF